MLDLGQSALELGGLARCARLACTTRFRLWLKLRVSLRNDTSNLSEIALQFLARKTDCYFGITVRIEMRRVSTMDMRVIASRFVRGLNCQFGLTL